jgi:hypothetical protein
MIDLTKFYRFNVIDTCSIWNILSSKLYYQTTLMAKCEFSCTKFVMYECLFKPRKSTSSAEIELQERLKKEQAKGYFRQYPIDIEDLQDIDVLTQRKNLSKGELSSMVFAKKTNQGFLTDDQGARKLASYIMAPEKVQTTPHLIGWLVFNEFLNDAEMELIITEHESLKRPLKKYYHEVFMKAMEYRLLKRAE